MDRSVYIVANKQQEHDILEKLVRNGYEHPCTDKKKYTFTPSIDGIYFSGFPYKIISDNDKHLIYWSTDNGYTETQVREILIKLLNSKNAMRRDMTAEQVVDEFMERVTNDKNSR